MENTSRSPSAKPGLPLILLAAVVQGWALYGLHLALKEHYWPATQPTWLSALYALAVFIPVTLELLAEHARLAALWVLAAVLAAAYFYFGWHHGGVFSTAGPNPIQSGDEYFSLGCLLTLLWLMALYALTMRSSHYGLTVGRVWGLVVASAALAYSVGYSLAALGKGAWLGGMARVNVPVALALIAVIAAALTPVLSPYRLAADSQFRVVRDKGLAALSEDRANQNLFGRDNALQYLRFDSGRYGVARLRELAGSARPTPTMRRCWRSFTSIRRAGPSIQT
jgi:hypothetical protein